MSDKEIRIEQLKEEIDHCALAGDPDRLLVWKEKHHNRIVNACQAQADWDEINQYFEKVYLSVKNPDDAAEEPEEAEESQEDDDVVDAEFEPEDEPETGQDEEPKVIIPLKKEEVVWRNVRRTFTPTERQEMSDKLVDQISRRNQVEAEKKVAVSEFNDDIKAIELEINTLAGKLKDGWEQRDVQCRTERDYDARVIRFIDIETDMEVDSKEMSYADRQRRLDDAIPHEPETDTEESETDTEESESQIEESETETADDEDAAPDPGNLEGDDDFVPDPDSKLPENLQRAIHSRIKNKTKPQEAEEEGGEAEQEEEIDQ